jgi:hypothetical protein
MQWSHAPSAGFSRGLPWEPLLPDSLTANVEALNGDAASILNQYRRLIHLRADNPALGEGELIPLTASSPQVVAYLRSAPGHTVLVMANLGATAVAAPAVSSTPRALGPGRYAATGLLGGDGRALAVRRDGALHGYAPFAALAPLEARVVELAPR